MSQSPKETFKVETVHKAFFTGGVIQWTKDGQVLLTQCGSSIHVVDIPVGKPSGCLGKQNEDGSDELDDDITTFALSDCNDFVVTSHKSGLFKLWNLPERRMEKQWKSVHKGPVARLAFSPDSNLVASGGSDSSIRIWNLKYQACTKRFFGLQGVVSCLRFHERDDDLYLLGAADDTVIRCWNVETGDITVTFTGHYSPVTGIDVTQDGKRVVSCGRDKVLILWDFALGKSLHVIPLYETVEALALLPPKIHLPGFKESLTGGIYVAVGGEQGVVRIWNVEKPLEIFTQKDSLVSKSKDDTGAAITHLQFNKATKSFMVASADHNIFFHKIKTFECTKQLVGFSDEVLDIAIVGKTESHLAVASNSVDVKLYKMDDMNCQLLSGHSDLVIALAVSSSNASVFASSSKDNSIKLWLLDEESGTARKIASALGHGNSVGAICFSSLKLKYLLSGSHDTTLKLWKIPKEVVKGESDLMIKAAKVGHEKDINSIAVSPNDQIVATGSLDKTAKLWSSEDLTLLGALRGHKRGVWYVRFSPFDQVLLTASADSTIKLWSIKDLNCLKTFEGHDASVLNAVFLSRGTQILSCGGDGLLKLWSIKSGECVNSFDQHDGKIWALAVLKDESKAVTGGSDSLLVVWRDVTEERKLEEARKLQEKALAEQELANLLKSEDLLNALKLALSLNRPATVLKIIEDAMSSNRAECLSSTISQLDLSEKQTLLNCATHWNSNSKFCHVAQRVLSLMMNEILSGKLQASKHSLETLISFTDKHFKRLSSLHQELQLVEFLKIAMKPTSVSVPME